MAFSLLRLHIQTSRISDTKPWHLYGDTVTAHIHLHRTIFRTTIFHYHLDNDANIVSEKKRMFNNLKDKSKERSLFHKKISTVKTSRFKGYR